MPHRWKSHVAAQLFVYPTVEEFGPSVIELSFGIGRVMYSLFEHNFKIREGGSS